MDMAMMSPAGQIKAADDIGLVGDHRGLNRLRTLGRSDDIKSKAQALKAAAEQFESMLTERWIDAMRQSNETINPDSPLHSRYSSMFEDMLSQQRVGSMVRQSGGLSKNSITYMVAKQFAKSMGDEGKKVMAELEKSGTEISRVSHNNAIAVRNRPLPQKFSDIVEATPAASVQAVREAYESLPEENDMRSFSGPEDFVAKMMPFAVKAAEGTGFNPLVLVTQAALETGWGGHIPRGNNYYGIKASRGWSGDSEALASDEFENGRMVSRVSSFRKYPSVLESMRDYISFITGNPRYAKAVGKSYNSDEYFEEIQRAGYATDPNYADKLKAISRKVAFMAQD